MVAHASSIADIQLATLTERDIEKLDLSDPDHLAAANLLDSFENEWRDFLHNHSDILVGRSADEIRKLEEEMRTVEESKDAVELELEEQLDAVRQSRKELEIRFGIKIEEEKLKQERAEERSGKIIERLRSATELLDTSWEWSRFIDEVDAIAAKEYESNDTRSGGKEAIAPTNRAILLSDLAGTLDDNDRFHKASKVELELAKAQHGLLNQEIAEHESLLPLLEGVAKMLELNKSSDPSS